MWPWQTPKSAPEAVVRRVNALEEQVRILVATVEPLSREAASAVEESERAKRAVREVQAEWENMYDKIYRAAQRAKSRQEPKEPKNEHPVDPEVSPYADPAAAAFWKRRMARHGIGGSRVLPPE